MQDDTSAIARKVAKRCKELGEDQVRQKLATGFFTDEWRPHAERWLAAQEQQRVRGLQDDANRHAKSAKNAAWAAAIAAIVAAIAAIASAVIAYRGLPS